MKISEFISGKFQTFGIQVSEADLLEMSINGNIILGNEVSAENMPEIYKAIATFMPSMLNRPKSINENGFSISWDTEGAKEYYRYLCKEYGIEDKLSSSITDKSDIW